MIRPVTLKRVHVVDGPVYPAISGIVKLGRVESGVRYRPTGIAAVGALIAAVVGNWPVDLVLIVEDRHVGSKTIAAGSAKSAASLRGTTL